MAAGINIAEFYQGLDKLFEIKNSRQTMDYLQEWLDRARASGDTSGIVAVSNEMGGFCRAMGDLGRARELHEDVLRRLEDMGMAHTEHYATALINLGDVYVNSRELDKAQKFFLQAKELLERIGMSGDYRMAALCNNISMVYRDTGEYEKAEEALNIAFNIIKGLDGSRGELATTYINLGELQVRQGKLEMATESFMEACRIFSEDGGTDVHYSAACAGLAQALELKGETERAAEYYQKAMELIERDFGRTDYYNMIADKLRRLRGV